MNRMSVFNSSINLNHLIFDHELYLGFHNIIFSIIQERGIGGEAGGATVPPVLNRPEEAHLPPP